MSSFLGSVQYDDAGVPRLSADDLEEIAVRVGSDFDRHQPLRPERLPVATFLERLQAGHGAKVEFRDFPRAGRSRVLGMTRLSDGVIQLSEHLLDERNGTLFHFTAAHEVGHWVLHRSKVVRRVKAGTHLAGVADKEGHFKLRFHRRGVVDTPRGWMEYQANRFAAFLLMPRVAFERGLGKVQAELGISQNRGVVWETPANLADVEATVKALAKLFGVSATAAKYHLENLGLLNSSVRARGAPKGPFAFPS